MGIYRDRVLPHLVDRACGSRELSEWRARVTEGLWGTIVEIGFGSGLNVPVYPADVHHVFAVEPAHVARRLAEPRVAKSHARIEHVGLDGQLLPLPDASCDGALSTSGMVQSVNVDSALGELRRVLRPGGRFHFLEHGIAPDAGVAAWQRRPEPRQRRVADGCHLTRDPVALVRAAGFEVLRYESRFARGPKPWSYMTEGFAISA